MTPSPSDQTCHQIAQDRRWRQERCFPLSGTTEQSSAVLGLLQLVFHNHGTAS